MNFGISKEAFEGAVEEFERLYLPGANIVPPRIPSDDDAEADDCCPVCGSDDGFCWADEGEGCPSDEEDRGRAQRPR